MSASSGSYYLPNPSPWPIITSAGLFTLALGFVFVFISAGPGRCLITAGAAIIVYMMFRWCGQVIGESESGAYNAQVDLSFRWGMSWFIFSEVMFFAAFFGALFYARQITLPLLGETELLWPGFDGVWPSSGPKGNPFTPMAAWGIPAVKPR